jgi:peptidoglycan glycosyltransferase
MVGKPTYDPNKLAVHDPKALLAYYNSLDPNSGTSALINFPVAHPIEPGSTFKVITTSAIFDHDQKIETQVFPVRTSIKIPGTDLLFHNFGSEACGGALAEILAASCDTAYAKVGLELGARSLYAEATAFGLNAAPPIDLPQNEVATSCFPPVVNDAATSSPCYPTSYILANPSADIPIGQGNQPFVAYSSIGQGNVSETALQNALVAAGIANGGQIMAPHLMNAIVNDEGQVVASYRPHVWKVATSSATADAVRSLMLGVATHGTAAGVFPPSLDVAAKTGTAETGLVNCSSTWMIATAPAGPNDTPKIAVAAVIPAQAGIRCSETGAEVAGPVVAKVLEAALGHK